MVLIDVFNEWLDSSFLDKFLFVDGPFDLLGIPSDAYEEEMGEPVLLRY